MSQICEKILISLSPENVDEGEDEGDLKKVCCRVCVEERIANFAKARSFLLSKSNNS